MLRTAHGFFDCAGLGVGALIHGRGRVGFGGSRSHLGTLFGDVSSFATEQAEVLLETALSLCLREHAVFSEL